MMDAKAEAGRLRARWTKAQVVAFNRGLAQGRPDSPFGTIRAGGMMCVDARGVMLAEHVETPLRGLDLSYCVRQPGVTLMTAFRECRLVGAELSTNVGEDLVACDLSEANLRRASLFGRFERCRFGRANLWKADGVRVHFVRCDFTRAVLTKASLYECVFDRCVWDDAAFGGGSLADSQFLGARPSEDALGDTILESDG